MKSGAAQHKTAQGGNQAGKLRALLPLALTVAATAFITVRFFVAANETLAATRQNACRSLAPDPIPAALRAGDAPDFKLPDATGRMISLSEQRGHPVVVNFWATWCPPCVEEIPALEELARTLEGTDARLLAVSLDEGWEPIRRFFVKGTKIGVLLDLSKEVPKRYTTEKYPETFFVDAQGKIRYYFVNKRNWAKPETAACLESLR